MAKNRYINTRFWSDNFIRGLAPLDRYVFLYFLTNEHTNISGTYELPVGTMVYETGIKERELFRIIERLKGKIYWIDGWIYIKNFVKHQTQSISVMEGVRREMMAVPEEVMAKIKAIMEVKADKTDPVYTPTPPPRYLTLPYSTKPNLTKGAATPRINAEEFFKAVEENSERLTSFLVELSQKTGSSIESLHVEVQKFASYWTELNQSGTKQRWEKEPVFEVKKRLATWLGNVSKYQNRSKTKQIL